MRKAHYQETALVTTGKMLSPIPFRKARVRTPDRLSYFAKPTKLMHVFYPDTQDYAVVIIIAKVVKWDSVKKVLNGVQMYLTGSVNDIASNGHLSHIVGLASRWVAAFKHLRQRDDSSKSNVDSFNIRHILLSVKQGDEIYLPTSDTSWEVRLLQY